MASDPSSEYKIAKYSKGLRRLLIGARSIMVETKPLVDCFVTSEHGFH